MSRASISRCPAWGVSVAATLLLGGAVRGQPSNVLPAQPFAWAENIGWANWADAGDPARSQGVRVHARILSGFVWSENVGWISVGNGAPAECPVYSNQPSPGISDPVDFGVNIDPETGNLHGLAWGEAIGWVNFDTAPTLSAFGQQARADFAARRLRGFAWAENVGWINLDDPTNVIAFCRTDFNGDGISNPDDLGDYITTYFQYDPAAEYNADCTLNPDDIGDFITEYYMGLCD